VRLPLARAAPASGSPAAAAAAAGAATAAAAGAGVGAPPPLCLELALPRDCGNGYNNAGVSLARLLWTVPVPAMLTLVASLLLERRVLLVGQGRDAVSAAVAAANALLYPFRWQRRRGGSRG
jgi:hypothetical protein